MRRMADEGAVTDPPGDGDGMSPERGVADVHGTAGPGLAGDSPTGDDRVDAVIARLGELAETPLEQHAALFGEVHDRLRGVLGELDAGTPEAGTLAPGVPGPPR